MFITQLSVPAMIGVFPEERSTPQPLLIDIEYTVDAKRIAETDQIDQAVDYAAVRRAVIEFIEKAEFHLLETLADRMAHHLLQQFSVHQIELRLTKKPFDMPDAQGAGVVVVRSSDSC